MRCFCVPFVLFGLLLPALLSTGCGLPGGGGFQPPTSRETWIDELLAAEDARDGGHPLFRQALDESDQEVRRFAYRSLGRIGAADSIALLVASALQEPDPELRAEAVHAIGLTRRSSVVEAAEAFILDPDERVRAAVIRALGLSGDDRGMITLLDALEDQSELVRSEATLALARLFASRSDPLGGRSVGAFLVLGERMRRDVSSEVRWRAAYAGAMLKLEELRRFLLDGLNDEDHRVRLFACVGLAELEPRPDTRRLLIEALQDEAWVVVVEAVKALGKDPSSETLLALSGVLGQAARPGHPSFHVRAAAARALQSFGGTEGAEAVVRRALADARESVRGEALEALALVGEPESVLALFESLQLAESGPSTSTYFRSRIAAAAAALPEGRGLGIVEALAVDDAVSVRSVAITALARFPDRKQDWLPYLRAALARREVALRDAAANCAAALGLTALLPDLERALRDSAGAEFIEPRVSSLKAIGALGGLSSLPLLREYLSDGERAVRTAARDELARLGGAIPELPRPARPERLVAPRAGRDCLTGRERPRVKLITTRGPFVLELLVDEAPHHALAFLDRCRRGFYDGLSFHRLVPGFVVQGLDPRGDGYGTGRLSLRSEINQQRYLRGSVGMPDAGLDTGGCQIFVTFRPQPRLDDRYTIFARVVEGMDVVEELDVGDRVDYVVAPPAPDGPETSDS